MAASPTSLSESVKATVDGVVLLPNLLAMIVTLSPSHTPTQLYVVPRSIPIHTSWDEVAMDEGGRRQDAGEVDVVLALLCMVSESRPILAQTHGSYHCPALDRPKEDLLFFFVVSRIG